jgi:hypothetical protein
MHDDRITPSLARTATHSNPIQTSEIFGTKINQSINQDNQVTALSSQYTGDGTITALTDYHSLYIRLRDLDPNALVVAPEGGWPKINGLGNRDKIKEAIELLRHLPHLGVCTVDEPSIPRASAFNITKVLATKMIQIL